MPLIPTLDFQKRLAALPLATYEAGETVFAAGSKTGLLLILKKGAVAIIKNAVEIAKVVEPGSVLGEMSTLLGEPHTAEVRALETSQFYVADAAMVMQDPISLLYVATVLARRLDAANQTLLELKRQLQEGDPPDAVSKTIEAMQALLSASGTRLTNVASSKMRFFIER